MSDNILKKPVDRAGFFASVKASLFGVMTQKQVDGCNAIINEFEKRQLTDLRWLAYMLATAFHETGRSMAAIEEYGKGAQYDYGKKLKRSRVAYRSPDELYYGRGLVQLTWFENYDNFSKILGIDLLNNPSVALQIDVAVQIMFTGMIRGLFTGVYLGKYFNAANADWTNARKIINGLDCAEKIADYAQQFYKALMHPLAAA